MDGWYYKLFDLEFGPVSMEKLVELVKRRSLGRDDQVRFGKEGSLRRIGSIGPLMTHLPFEAKETVIQEKSITDSQLALEAAYYNPVPVATQVSNTQNFDIDFSESVSFAKPQSFAESFAEKAVPNRKKNSDPLPDLDSQWRYVIQGREYGPVDLSQLIALVKSRRLSRNDQVRFGDNGSLRRVGSIGPLMAHLPFEADVKNVDHSRNPVRSNPYRSEDDDELSLTQTLGSELSTTKTFSKPNSTADTDNFADVLDSDTVESSKARESETRWWCIIQGKEYGPVALPKLIEWAATGRLRREDHVRFGIDPYVRADELPGLFPELPKTANAEPDPEPEEDPEQATNAHTAAVIAEIQQKLLELSKGSGTMPTFTLPATAENKSASASRSPVSTPATTTSAKPQSTSYAASSASSNNISSSSSMSSPMGAAQWTGAANGGAIRPSIPARPVPKSSSNGSGAIAKLLPILLGIGGVGLLGGLIFFVIQLLPADTTEDINRLKKLRDGYREMAQLREAGKPPAEADLTSAKERIQKATKSVKGELKKLESKTPIQTDINKLASKMNSVAESEFEEKASKVETDVSDLIKKLETALGVK